MTRSLGAPRARAWLELARISNAPTVVSNALAGAAIGSAAAGAPINLQSAVLVALGAVAIYTAGMVLNDVFDAETDRRERPERPIPSARIARTHAAAVGGGLLLAGPAVMFLAGPGAGMVGLGLAAVVLAYDAIHSRTSASVLLMGLCRALVYVAAIAVSVPLADRLSLLLAPAALALYTAAFSLLARTEADVRSTGRPVLAWMPLPLGLAVVAAASGMGTGVRGWWWGAIPAVALMLAAIRAAGPDGRRAVLTFIAAFSLIDAAVCASVGHTGLALACAGCWALTALGHRRILGT